MESTVVTRAHLEMLSTSDLLTLADDYGIDIPEELNRQLIIGELLEAAADQDDEIDEPVQEGVNPGLPEENTLPEHFNETSVTAIMRNPVWCYVYWDVSDSDKSAVLKSDDFEHLVLRVSFFENRVSAKARESYDIPVQTAAELSASDDEGDGRHKREQFILVPANELYVRIDLVALYAGEQESQILARSRMITISQGCPEISSIINESDISDIMKLSGLPRLIKTQYQSHRQSFS